MTRAPKRSSDNAGGHSAPERSRPRASHRLDRRKRRSDPLVASWRPVSEDGDDRGGSLPRTRRRRRGYVWRIYAVPLLIAVSALAVFQASDSSSGNQTSGGGGLFSPREQKQPVVTESPGQKFDPEIGSAELPTGGWFPVAGARTFRILPGSSPPVGSGNLYSYTVEAEVDAELAEGNDTFSRLVQTTLEDPRSWTNSQGGGVSFQRVDDPAITPDFRVTLVSQNTARELCDYGGGLEYDTSCRTGDRVYINAARYVRGAIAFEGDIGNYRRYAINHEVGHVLDNGHVACGQPGGLAPVMMQQTLSTANNELRKLNEHTPQADQIPANGFVCKPNAWPFPAPSSGQSPG